MTIKICKLRFDAELAVNGDLSSADFDDLRKAIETTIKQRGIYAKFMIGQNVLEVTEDKDERPTV